MKMKYETPTLEQIRFAAADIITASGEEDLIRSAFDAGLANIDFDLNAFTEA